MKHLGNQADVQYIDKLEKLDSRKTNVCRCGFKENPQEKYYEKLQLQSNLCRLNKMLNLTLLTICTIFKQWPH